MSVEIPPVSIHEWLYESLCNYSNEALILDAVNDYQSKQQCKRYGFHKLR